jgi:hypothetical protein
MKNAESRHVRFSVLRVHFARIISIFPQLSKFQYNEYDH